MSAAGGQPPAQGGQQPSSSQPAPGDGGAQPNQQPPDPPPQPQRGAEPPDTSTPDSDPPWLPKRLERAKQAAKLEIAKASGFDSIEAFEAWQAQAKEAMQAQEEAKRQQMSELERLKADLAARDARLAEAESQAKQAQLEAEGARIEAHIQRLCAERGIKNADYVFWKLEQAASALGDDDELDEVKFLDDLVKDEAQRAALGVSSAPQPRPADTSPPQGGPHPKPEDQGQFDALKLSDEEWRAHKAKLGLH